jgi:hypothetical protein
MLIPRWKLLPQKMGEGRRNWGGFMMFFGEPRWGHRSVVEKGREADQLGFRLRLTAVIGSSDARYRIAPSSELID